MMFLRRWPTSALSQTHVAIRRCRTITFDPFSLKHTRDIFFWRVHTPAIRQTIDDSTHPIYTHLHVAQPSPSISLLHFQIHSLHNLNEPTAQKRMGSREVAHQPLVYNYKQGILPDLLKNRFINRANKQDPRSRQTSISHNVNSMRPNQESTSMQNGTRARAEPGYEQAT
jgi:hypothetical protein